MVSKGASLVKAAPPGGGESLTVVKPARILGS
jgi:hypothetical protein